MDYIKVLRDLSTGVFILFTGVFVSTVWTFENVFKENLYLASFGIAAIMFLSKGIIRLLK